MSDDDGRFGYLPNVTGIVCAVTGMIVSLATSEGPQVITMTGKLAGLGYIVGYPLGMLIRAVIVRVF